MVTSWSTRTRSSSGISLLALVRRPVQRLSHGQLAVRIGEYHMYTAALSVTQPPAKIVASCYWRSARNCGLTPSSRWSSTSSVRLATSSSFMLRAMPAHAAVKLLNDRDAPVDPAPGS